MGRFVWRWSDAPPRPGFALGIFCLCLGLEMVLQPQRFSRTPAYGNITHIFDIKVWGVGYLVAAALFLSYTFLVQDRTVAVVIHLLGSSLLVWWFIAFFVRRGSDGDTTGVTVIAWAAFIYLAVLSLKTTPKIKGRLPKETLDT